MRMFIIFISLFVLLPVTFVMLAQNNSKFFATQMTINENNFNEVILNNVLNSECYLKHKNSKLMEMYFYNEYRDKSILTVRVSFLGYFETNYKYEGFYKLQNTFFLIKGKVPKGLFAYTKFRIKFVYNETNNDNVAVGACPLWKFIYKNKKISLIWRECGE